MLNDEVNRDGSIGLYIRPYGLQIAKVLRHSVLDVRCSKFKNCKGFWVYS